jgi:hypothetical protein
MKVLFHLDTTPINNFDDINHLNKDSFLSKTLPTKIDHEKLSPCLSFRPQDVKRNVLRLNTQVEMSVIHYL